MKKKKIITQEKIQSNNLLENSSQIMGECINCGICKSACPIFRVLREERVSGRGQAVLLRDKVLDKNVFESTMDGLSDAVCPKGVKISDAILNAREALVLLDEGLKENQKMVENVMKYGSPYGKIGEEKTDKVYS